VKTLLPPRVADDATQRPNPEVPERARRQAFSAKYKLEVLAAYDAAPDGCGHRLIRRRHSQRCLSSALARSPIARTAVSNAL
jgi:hypothetical protein